MTALIVVHVIVCFFLVGIILLQPGKSDIGLGFGGGSSQSIFGSKGAGNFLTKATAISAVLFLLLSYGITRLRINEARKSVVDSIPADPASSAPAKPVEAPKAGSADNKKDEKK